MRLAVFAFVVGSVCLPGVYGESSIAIDESKIRAVLRNNSTAVLVPVSSSADHALRGILTIQWVNDDDQQLGAVRRDVTIPPGESAFESPLPFGKSSIWKRLRYNLTLSPAEARASPPLSGIVSVSQIADYVFELKASYAGVARRGSRIVVHAEAIQPATRMPVSGVQWSAALSVDGKKLNPVRTIKREDGFNDFTFDIPAAEDDEGDEEASVEITARRGDFKQDATVAVEIPPYLERQAYLSTGTNDSSARCGS